MKIDGGLRSPPLRMMSSSHFKTLRFSCSKAGRRCCQLLIAPQFWLLGALLLVVAWLVSGIHFSSERASLSWNDDLPELDSFSQPALAIAILQQHVRKLFLTYALTNEPPPAVGTTNGWAVTITNSQRPKQLDRSSGVRQGPQSGEQGSCLDSLQALDGRLRALRTDLLHHLMVLQYRNRSWNEFLDTYLEILAMAPEKAGIAPWARSALACSQTCQRTDEVLDALQHVARFSKDARTAARLQGVLEDWNAGRIPHLVCEDGSSI
jgi:hypothetical protein